MADSKRARSESRHSQSERLPDREPDSPHRDVDSMASAENKARVTTADPLHAIALIHAFRHSESFTITITGLRGGGGGGEQSGFVAKRQRIDDNRMSPTHQSVVTITSSTDQTGFLTIRNSPTAVEPRFSASSPPPQQQPAKGDQHSAPAAQALPASNARTRRKARRDAQRNALDQARLETKRETEEEH